MSQDTQLSEISKLTFSLNTDLASILSSGNPSSMLEAFQTIANSNAFAENGGFHNGDTTFSDAQGNLHEDPFPTSPMLHVKTEDITPPSSTTSSAASSVPSSSESEEMTQTPNSTSGSLHTHQNNSTTNNNTNGNQTFGGMDLGPSMSGIQKKRKKSISASSPGTKPKTKSQQPAQQISCSNCNAVKTPLWRKGEGGRTLCNKCGLYWSRHAQHRPLKLDRSSRKKQVDPNLEKIRKSAMNMNMSRRHSLPGDASTIVPHGDMSQQMRPPQSYHNHSAGATHYHHQQHHPQQMQMGAPSSTMSTMNSMNHMHTHQHSQQHVPQLMQSTGYHQQIPQPQQPQQQTMPSGHNPMYSNAMQQNLLNLPQFSTHRRHSVSDIELSLKEVGFSSNPMQQNYTFPPQQQSHSQLQISTATQQSTPLPSYGMQAPPPPAYMEERSNIQDPWLQQQLSMHNSANMNSNPSHGGTSFSMFSAATQMPFSGAEQNNSSMMSSMQTSQQPIANVTVPQQNFNSSYVSFNNSSAPSGTGTNNVFSWNQNQVQPSQQMHLPQQQSSTGMTFFSPPATQFAVPSQQRRNSIAQIPQTPEINPYSTEGINLINQRRNSIAAAAETNSLTQAPVVVPGDTSLAALRRNSLPAIVQDTSSTAYGLNASLLPAGLQQVQSVQPVQQQEQNQNLINAVRRASLADIYSMQSMNNSNNSVNSYNLQQQIAQNMMRRSSLPYIGPTPTGNTGVNSVYVPEMISTPTATTTPNMFPVQSMISPHIYQSHNQQ